jgi:hypothetical protein
MIKDWKLIIDGCGCSLSVRTIFISLHLVEGEKRGEWIYVMRLQCLNTLGGSIGSFLILVSLWWWCRLRPMYELYSKLGSSCLRCVFCILLGLCPAKPDAAPVAGPNLQGESLVAVPTRYDQ